MPNGGMLYAIGIEGSTLVKIGSTRTSLKRRLSALQTGQPFPLSVRGALAIEGDVLEIESQVHRFLADQRQRGEWFDVTLPDTAALEDLVRRVLAWVAAQDAQHATEPLTTEAATWGTNLGHRLALARHTQRYAQQDLARLVGISQKHLSQLEKSRVPFAGLAVGTLRGLAEVLEVSADYLLGLTNDPTPYWTRQEVPHG